MDRKEKDAFHCERTCEGRGRMKCGGGRLSGKGRSSRKHPGLSKLSCDGLGSSSSGH